MRLLAFYLLALIAIIPLFGHISNIDQMQTNRHNQLIEALKNEY